MDDEFNEHEEICEGIDNVERIHRHFEKTLVEKYKTKKTQMQQNNPSNPSNPSHNSHPNPASHPIVPNNHPNISSVATPQNPSHHPNGPNQASTIRSSAVNESRKKTYIGQKSQTFFEMNTTNMKYFDSTVLHFSTTYNNTNSSAMTLQDESIDSIDELSTNQNLMNLEFILLPENSVYFKIFDLFSVLSEKVHETLSTKYQNAFETERPTNEHIVSPDIITLNHTRLKSRAHSDKEEALETSRIFSEYPPDPHFKIYIKGLYMDPTEEYNTKVIKKRTNAFLLKYEKKLSWILNQVDMNSAFFYEMEIEQLEILENFLHTNTSKIMVFEVVDSVFELLLLVKKQILDLSSGFVNTQPANATTTPVVSPSLTNKAHRTGSITRELPTPSAPTSSTNIANAILKPILKPTLSSRNMMNQELSPQKTLEFIDKEKGRPGNIFNSLFNTSFIFKQKALFMSYLGITSKLIARAPKMELLTLFNNVYVGNESWVEIVRLFAVSTFQEVQLLNEKYGDSNEAHLNKDQIHSFIYAKKILEYYTSNLVMCNTIIFEGKLGSSSGDSAKEKQKKEVKKILQSMVYLVKPSNGILTNYIKSNTNLNSLIIDTGIKSLSNYSLLRLNLFKAIFEFLKKIFSINIRFNHSENDKPGLNEDVSILSEEISNFYIRFSYINFVKLYGHSSNSELNEINRKIVEIGNRVKGKVGRENFNENVDRVENEFNRKNMRGTNNELKTYQIHFSTLYIKVLLAIAKNRNDAIKRIFYQYRILEFFTREIDLEFDVSFRFFMIVSPFIYTSLVQSLFTFIRLVRSESDFFGLEMKQSECWIRKTKTLQKDIFNRQ